MLTFTLSTHITNKMVCLDNILLDCFVCGRYSTISVYYNCIWYIYIVDIITFHSIFISGKFPFDIGMLPVFISFMSK